MKHWQHYSKNKKRYAVGLGIAIIIGLACWAWQTPAKPSKDPIAVTVATARLGDLSPKIDSIGTAVAYNETQIQSQVSGQLKEIRVTPGQTVQQGDVLFIIDPAPFQALLDQAIAIAHKDQATETFSLQQLERYRDLVKSGYVSKDFFGQVLAAAKTAKAAVLADQAAVATAQLNLQHCTITAPIGGRLSDIAPNIGDLVSASATTSLASIKQFSPIEVQFSLPAKQLPFIQQSFDTHQTQVIATSSDDAHLHAIGTVDFIDNQIDVNTGSIIMKAKFSNAPVNIWPGQLLQIQVLGATEKQVVLVPNEAIRQNQQGKSYVYRILANHKAQLTLISIGASADDMTVVQSGLQAGDLIVTQGQFRLDDGTLVKDV